MTKTLGVGIIGASAARGWAKDSHVPAIQGLDGLRLAAVAAGDEKKAQEAKEAFGAGAGYVSGFDLSRILRLTSLPLRSRYRIIATSSLPPSPPANMSTVNGRLEETWLKRKRWQKPPLQRGSARPSACRCGAALPC